MNLRNLCLSISLRFPLSGRLGWVLLVVLLLGAVPAQADPGAPEELVPIDGYLDGHVYRALEMHLDGPAVFRIIGGAARVRKDRESLVYKMVNGEFLLAIDRLEVELVRVDLAAERAAASPQIFRRLQNGSRGIVVTSGFDTPNTQLIGNLLRKGPSAWKQELPGIVTAYLSETTSKEGAKATSFVAYLGNTHH